MFDDRRTECNAGDWATLHSFAHKRSIIRAEISFWAAVIWYIVRSCREGSDSTPECDLKIWQFKGCNLLFRFWAERVSLLVKLEERLLWYCSPWSCLQQTLLLPPHHHHLQNHKLVNSISASVNIAANETQSCTEGTLHQSKLPVNGLQMRKTKKNVSGEDYRNKKFYSQHLTRHLVIFNAGLMKSFPIIVQSGSGTVMNFAQWSALPYYDCHLRRLRHARR